MLTTILMAFNIHSSILQLRLTFLIPVVLESCRSYQRGGGWGGRTPEYASCMFYHVTDGQRHGRRKSL